MNGNTNDTAAIIDNVNAANGQAPDEPTANGGSTATVRRQVQRVVVDAINIAAERGRPLGVALQSTNGNGTNGAHGANGNNGHHADGADWQGVAPLLDNLQRVNLAATLGAIAPRMEAVEAEIENLVAAPVKLIADIASHTLNAGGKRLRPALTLLAAEVCGDGGDVPAPRVVTCAAAIELTHTTTLLHDDVVDGAATRRGRPTANHVWGNETSVLVGDYLFAQVFVTAAQKGFAELMFPLAHATAQLCAGEILETQMRACLEMTESQYYEIIALKTAALTECACRLGAMAMDAPPEDVERLARYGYDMGMAFQIVDDVFDVIATAGRLGKPVGNDIREGDITLPMLRAMQVCDAGEREELRALVGKADITDAEVQRALAILRGCDAVDYAVRAARGYIDSAQAQLSQFAPSPARTMLSEIATYVLTRDK